MSMQNLYKRVPASAGWDPEPRPFQVYTARQWDRIPQLSRLPASDRFDMRVVADVLPFRVNQYVIDELIDWGRAPADPIFQLTFPQRAMLAPEDFERMAALHRRGADGEAIRTLAQEIRAKLNPHPAGQREHNVPYLGGQRMEGIQHKYHQTVLFFPSQGQTCHSYCTFCFRWAQFIGDRQLRFAANESGDLHRYLAAHTEVSDLLITGGDPMVMKAHHLAQYLLALTSLKFEHIRNVRIGTKALAFWPHRFVTDPDADDLLRLLEALVRAGKHVAVMAHYDHWRELDTPIAREAVRRVLATGAVIRSQAPLLAHINDDAQTWARLWRTQVQLGIIPYYMFVERDTGARRYFEVPWRAPGRSIAALCAKYPAWGARRADRA